METRTALLMVDRLRCSWKSSGAVPISQRLFIAHLDVRQLSTQPRRRFTKDAVEASTSENASITENGSEVISSSTLPPHSLLPTNMLVRSALVSTISSKPFLLKIGLRVLGFLSSTKISLFRADKNPVIHAVLKQTFYNHFCAGENGTEVANTIRNLKEIGFKGVILTYAKEIVVDASLNEKGKGTLKAEAGATESKHEYSPDIDSWKAGVLETVRLLEEGDYLAIKLTGAGASVMTALSSNNPLPPQMAEALDEVCTEALNRNVKILVDAEQQSIQNGIDNVAVDLMRKYNLNGNVIVYNTYQAYLKSTPETLRKHMEVATSENFAMGVKLVRGAYLASEPRHLINDTKADTDVSYNSIAEGLLTRSYEPFTTKMPESTRFPATDLFLATHNKESAIFAYKLHKDRLAARKPTTNVQYGQLLGMADEVSCTLLQMGQNTGKDSTSSPPEVYKCLSWGTLEDCLSYLLRRARENQDAVGRTQTEYTTVWAELRRRMKPAFLS